MNLRTKRSFRFFFFLAGLFNPSTSGLVQVFESDGFAYGLSHTHFLLHQWFLLQERTIHASLGSVGMVDEGLKLKFSTSAFPTAIILIADAGVVFSSNSSREQLSNIQPAVIISTRRKPC